MKSFLNVNKNCLGDLKNPHATAQHAMATLKSVPVAQLQHCGMLKCPRWQRFFLPSFLNVPQQNRLSLATDPNRAT
jgi:hypothetical protein